MDDKFNVSIKRASLDVTMPRFDLISCDETPDGLTFKFKGGLIISIEDQNMPSTVKQQVSLADVTFKKGNLVIDLNNYRSPVSISTF